MSGQTSVPESFEISIADRDIVDLHDRLRRTRFADDFENENWSYGVPESYMRELVDYWVDGFDWRRQEARMMEFEHRRVVVDDVPIHFIFQPGRGKRTIPIVLNHGWPWTFWDFAKVIQPLADPASVGAPDDLAFDVIVPSLPGHAFSSPLRRRLGDADIADLWVRLMTDVLGYDRFGSHGGDRGALVTAELAHGHADRLIGAHMSLPVLPGVDYGAITAADYAPGEEGWFESWTSRFHLTRSHLAVHRDSPQTLAWALNDSPAGLAAWIVERRHNWSAWEESHEEAFTKDDLLTTVCLYWFTQTFHTSARLYAETRREPWRPRHARRPRFEAPVGMAVFPGELVLSPRAMMEEHANLVHWTVMPRGGHFAAHEQPELLVEDLRAFFGTVAPA